MEKNVKPNEWELQCLLEQKNFKELSAPEKRIVKELITAEEYEIRRQLIIEVKKESENIVPLPLVLTKKKVGVVIPMYQTVLAIVATVLVMFFLKIPYTNMEYLEGSENIKYVSVTDTIKEIEYVYDTIYKEIEKTKTIERKVYVSVPKIKYVEINKAFNSEEREVLNSPNNYQLPDLNALINEVDGSQSLAEDSSIALLPSMIYRD